MTTTPTCEWAERSDWPCCWRRRGLTEASWFISTAVVLEIAASRLKDVVSKEPTCWCEPRRKAPLSDSQTEPTSWLHRRRLRPAWRERHSAEATEPHAQVGTPATPAGWDWQRRFAASMAQLCWCDCDNNSCCCWWSNTERLIVESSNCSTFRSAGLLERPHWCTGFPTCLEIKMNVYSDICIISFMSNQIYWKWTWDTTGPNSFTICTSFLDIFGNITKHRV